MIGGGVGWGLSLKMEGDAASSYNPNLRTSAHVVFKTSNLSFLSFLTLSIPFFSFYSVLLYTLQALRMFSSFHIRFHLAAAHSAFLSCDWSRRPESQATQLRRLLYSRRSILDKSRVQLRYAFLGCTQKGKRTVAAHVTCIDVYTCLG